MTVGTLAAFLRLDDSQFNKSLNDAEKNTTKSTESIQKRFEKLGDSLAKTGKKLTMFVTAPIIALGVAFVKSAIDAEETESKFNIVFSNMAEDAKAATDSLVNGFGFAREEAQRLLSDTGDLLTGFGFTQESALALSRQTNELAADLASFRNFAGGAAGASEALTKAMLGESESAKALGIVIRQDSDEYKDLVKYYMEAEGASLLQAKALTALKIATEQSKNAVGNFKLTQEETANQLKILKGDIKDLAADMGAILLPIVNELVGKLIDAVKVFSGFSDETKKNILIIGGLTAAVGPAVLVLGKMIQSVKILIPLLKILGSPAGLIGMAAVALGLFVGQYVKWKKQQQENAELLNKNNEILYGTKIAINGVTTSLGLENAERIKKLELIRAEQEYLLELEEISLEESKRAAAGLMTTRDARGLVVALTQAQIDAEKAAIPISEKRIGLLNESLDLLDAAIEKTKEGTTVTTEGGEESRKSWQDYNKEVQATIDADFELIRKQEELAEAMEKPFDAIAEKKKVLEDAINTLLNVPVGEIDEPFEVTDKTIQALITQLRDLGYTEEEIAAIQIEATEKVLAKKIAMNAKLREIEEKKAEDAAIAVEQDQAIQDTVNEITARRRQEQFDAEVAVEEAITKMNAVEEAKRIKIAEDAEARKRYIIQQTWNLVSSLSTSLSKLITSFNNKEISEIEAKYKTLIEAAGDNAEAVTALERQKAEEINAIKVKEAKANKAFAIFDIALKTAQAIIGFLANPSGPAGVALSIAAGVIGAIQIGAVAAQPLPALAEGGLIGGNPGVDQNLAMVSRGEFVMPVEQTSQNLALLEAIRSGQSVTNNIQPIAAPVLLDGRIVGEVMISFIESEANNGRLALNPQAIRADV